MDEKITISTLEKMKPGCRPKTFRCQDAASLASARQTVYNANKRNPRPDGAIYKVSTSYTGMTVTVSVVFPDKTE